MLPRFLQPTANGTAGYCALDASVPNPLSTPAIFGLSHLDFPLAAVPEALETVWGPGRIEPMSGGELSSAVEQAPHSVAAVTAFQRYSTESRALGSIISSSSTTPYSGASTVLPNERAVIGSSNGNLFPPT